ncbi:MAG: acyltransferase family protein [Clostridiales bacterium]|nr:acyltransferase family protein [Clostridiales bacterium]
MEKKTGSRIEYIDALRTLACFAVVLLHVSAFNTANVPFKSHEWNVFMVFEALTNWAVPVFVMISGAMMLSKEYSYKDILKKAGKLAFVFFIWSFLYLISDILIHGSSAFVKDFIWLQVFLQGHYHMWYLIMLFGLYLIVPFMKPIAKDKKLLKAFLILAFIFGFFWPSVRDLMMIGKFKKILSVPFFGAIYRALINITDDLHLQMVLGFVGYFASGYAIHQIPEMNKKKAVICSLLMFVFGTVIVFCGLKASNSEGMAYTYLKYYQFGVFLQAAGLFMLFKHVGTCGLVSLIAKLSPMSLGIYLMHPMILEILNKRDVSTLSFTSEFSVPVLTIVVFAVCAIITKLLFMMKISAKIVKL